MLLAFDTATPLVTVALHDGERVVVEHSSEQPMKHGVLLAPLIALSLEDAGIVRQDLTAIAVGVGPGPFTGLRVGVVTARTLGFVLDVPVYGVCSLDAIALQVVETSAPESSFLVATDARRKEVYLASYAADGRRLERCGNGEGRLPARCGYDEARMGAIDRPHLIRIAAVLRDRRP